MINDRTFKRLMDISYALAEKGSGGRCNHIAFILNKSRILSIGLNKYNRTHPANQRYGYQPHQGIHAEMSAALKLGLEDCTGLSIISVRINRNGQISNSLFCKGCTNLVKALNFKSCLYTDDFGHLQEI